MGKVVPESRLTVETICESTVVEKLEHEISQTSHVSYVELRQRNLANGGPGDEAVKEEPSSSESSTGQWRPEANVRITRLETEGSFDWNKLLAKDPILLGEVSYAERSPLRYFIREIYSGNSLRSTISVGNEKKRQRVYNTMFHVPLRCERLILAGFFVCLDSFLSLLTLMPARIIMTIWSFLKTRQFQRPNAAELSDFGCFIILILGVTTLQLTDISLIYHFIRGQGTIKLYVVYNVLEIFDKLCQSFGEDVLQVLFSSAEGLANSSSDNMTFELMRFILDETIAIIAFIVHSFILLAQAVTLSTCIVAHNNALLALLVSNNFAEIKSNVFKRVSKDNLRSLVYHDIVERFHITAFMLFVLAQNLLEAEGPWFESFLTNALEVFMCEVFIDMIKHSFLTKFNEIKPDTYSEFLEDLSKQTLNENPEDHRKNLTFIPLAPACVVFRVMAPIYATLLPSGPLLWRLFWIISWSGLTYIMLAIWKVLVSLSLRSLATWYLNQRLERKQHKD
ncbi:protein POLLEN DEFECTIVE IN GUIDANCE 1 [Dioscorea cayenensis subsp. rotundata]|uniref:Protein POLLEN DEFECTIVE IN GUIDANCE 1 n=1 Tax=Dioscorea cayennensis subsp. rotundata TaxID=55577 RepID=A0AB40D3V3_DIOCR|nr:protein POLLEN DEFECTIVE IN GUIDANCE 1 [Dioscorea cayenensis subsp. rotundata]